MCLIKKAFVFIVLGSLLYSCKKEAAEPQRFFLESNGCATCPTASVDYEYIDSKQAVFKKIHADITQRITAFLGRGEANANSIKEAMQFFTAAEDYKKEYPEEDISNWNATVDGEIRYRNEDLLSFEFEFYSYAGGAHGYGETVLLTYNLHTGEAVALKEMLEKDENFMQMAEQRFRKQEEIPADGNINDTGFMFPEEVFILADNIGFNNNGLIIIYNQYEVSAYAEGKKELEIPWNQVKPFLKL